MCLKRYIAGIAAATILIGLAGCSAGSPGVEETGAEPITIRVLSNADTAMSSPSSAYGMDYEIRRLIGEYERAHEEVTIDLEFLPASGEERETRIAELRTEILAGNGPDVYLMSPYKLEQLSYNSYETQIDGGLFPDVAQSMYNGVFYDISAFYDGDTELHVDELAPGVMEMGTVDGARFVLPLRYTYPVVFADRNALDGAGMDVEHMKADLGGFFEELMRHADTASWFNGAAQVVMTLDPFYLIPQLIDYETGDVLLTDQELADFTRRCWEITDRCETILAMPGVSSYVQMGWFPLAAPGLEDGETDVWASMRAPLCIGGAATAISACAMAEVEGVDMELFPLRALDGSLVAEITWWGAVGAGCEHPETAYDFLRRMLLPETQWELKRPTGDENTVVSGFFGSGLPVRVIGAAQPLWNALKAQLVHFAGTDKAAANRAAALQSVSLTDADILPLLSARVDAARVPMALGSQWSEVLANRLEYEDALDSEARALIEELRWHLAEG